MFNLIARLRNPAAATGLGAGLFLLAFSSPIVYSVDENSMLAVALSIVTQGDVSVPAQGAVGKPGIGGIYYSKWYPLQSVVALPPVAAGVFLAHREHLPVRYVAGACALTIPPLLTAGTVALVAALALRLGASPDGAALAAIAYLFGTIAMVYSRTFFAEPLLGLITIGAVYCQLGDRRQQAAAAVLAALAVLGKPTGVILGPVLAAYAGFKDRSARAVLMPLAGTLAGFALYMAYNRIRFGNPLDFGQPMGGLRLANIPNGVTSLLITPARGVLWYCPVVFALAGLSGRVFKRPEALLIVAVALAYFGFYASWWDALGGWSWGPRLLLPALPGLVALTALLENRWRRALVALTMLGFLVNGPTLLSIYERVYQEQLLAHYGFIESIWSPAKAPFIEVWGATARELEDARHADVRKMVREAGIPGSGQPADWRALKIVNVWWWMLPLVGVPRVIGAAISAAVAAVGLFLMLSPVVNSSKPAGRLADDTLRAQERPDASVAPTVGP